MAITPSYDPQYENISPAISMDRSSGMREEQLKRRAFRRVFDPDPGEVAIPEDRERVLGELREYCFMDRSFEVSMGSNDVGYQIAGMEGKRSVYLRIMQAVRLSREDLKEPTPNIQAKTE